MKKILFLLITSLLVYSCTSEVRIKPEKRIQITGNLVQSGSNIPVSETSVASFGVIGELVQPVEIKKLGFGRTAETGIFNFISLDLRNGNFVVSVNPSGEDAYNDEYATLHFLDLEEYSGTRIAFGNIELPRLQKVDFIVQNTSGSREELRYNITYSNQELYYLLINGTGSDDVPEYYEEINNPGVFGFHNMADEPLVISIPTVEHTEAVFRYTLGDQEPQEIIIPITPETSEYVFEY